MAKAESSEITILPSEMTKAETRLTVIIDATAARAPGPCSLPVSTAR